MMMTQQRDFTSMVDVTPDEVHALIARAEAYKAGAQLHLTQPVYVSMLFFEHSTRTHTSFEMAETKLGLTQLAFNPAASSVSKGESLHDTLLTMAALGVNLAVIRHPEDQYYAPLLAAGDLDLALINAGDGSGEHPSQSMLDLMTISEEFGYFDGLRVVICGDIAHSRVARSNAEILQRLGAQVFFAGPAEWYDHQFDRLGTWVDLDSILPTVDVVMLLRIQRERHDTNDLSGAAYHEHYGLTLSRAQLMQPHAIIMHPGPVNRDVELASELVEGPQSRYVQQMQNGVFMRMAMIEAVLRANHLGGLEA